MKILYISSRINAPDGSSVHGRAFLRNVQKLGHEIQTYPQVQAIDYIQDRADIQRKSITQKLRNLFPAVKGRIRRLGRTASDLVDLWEGGEDSLRYFFGVRKILKTYTPDCIVYRSTLYNFGPHMVRRIYRLPCVAEVNSIKYLETSVASSSGSLAKLTRWAEQFAILRSDRVFVVSQPIKHFVDQFYNPNRCSVIPNGVETDDFNPDLFDREQIKSELNLSGKIVLGYVGSYKEWHGLPVSLETIARLHAADERYHLLLIGNGEQYQNIKGRIKSEQLEAMVTQIDYIPHDQVPRYTSVFDYAVMTYPDFEGFYFSPLKMYEYMAMGTLVVSTKTGQIGEMIDSGKTGELVYPPTVDNFCAAIQKLQADKPLRQQISSAARDEVLRHHSWLRNAQQVVAVCEELLEEQRASTRDKQLLN